MKITLDKDEPVLTKKMTYSATVTDKNTVKVASSAIDA